MAIFVFAVLILLGVLPNGMATMQSARRQAAETRILQHLRGAYQSQLDTTPAARLMSTLNLMEQPNDFFFDDRGDPVTRSINPQLSTSYAARVSLLPAHPLPGINESSFFLRRLRVALVSDWQDGNAFIDPQRHRQRLITITINGLVPPTMANP